MFCNNKLIDYLFRVNNLVAIDVLSRLMYLLFFIFLAINLGPSYGIEGICIGMLLGEIIRFSILIKYTANSMRINALSLLLITSADIKDFVIGCRALLFSLKSKNK